MKSLLLALLTLSAASSQPIDLGVIGQEYNITEANPQELWDKWLQDTNWTKKENELKKKFTEANTARSSLPACSETKEKQTTSYITVPVDVPDPQNGGLKYRAGERVAFSLPSYQAFAICFIDGAYPEKHIRRSLEAMGRCSTLLVANEDHREFSRRYDINAEPLHDIWSSTFNELSCFPTKIHYGKTTTVNTYHINMEADDE